MSCFCTSTLSGLSLALPALNISAAINLNATATAALNLSEYLNASAALGALNLNWLNLQLPRLNLSANMLLSASLMAQLRAQVLAHFGIDLLIPGQLNAFLRIMATLNARIGGLGLGLGLHLNFGPWLQLAALNAALLRIQAAITAGVFANLNLSLRLSLGPWMPFLLQLGSLTALLNLMARLNVTESVALCASLNAMASLRLPALPFPNISLMCNLSAGLSAVAQLGLSLGVNPLQLGFPAIRLMVGATLTATIQMLARIGISLNAALALTAPQLPAFMIGLPVASLNAMVTAALNVNVAAFANLNISLTPNLFAALSVSSLSAQLSAALNLGVALRPCMVCDAAGLLAAAIA